MKSNGIGIGGDASGYDNPAKRLFRRQIWAEHKRRLRHRRRAAKCLLMPSLLGDEIDVVLQNGFLEKNLHIVDRNPAVVATLKRRYPEVTTYGVELTRALTRMAEAGIEIDAAHLDFCSNLTPDRLADIAAAAARIGRGIMTVTALRGREVDFAQVLHAGRRLFALTDDSGMPGRDADRGRAALVLNAAGRYAIATMVRTNSYLSPNGQTFRWTTMFVHKSPCYCVSCLEHVIGLLGAGLGLRITRDGRRPSILDSVKMLAPLLAAARDTDWVEWNSGDKSAAEMQGREAFLTDLGWPPDAARSSAFTAFDDGGGLVTVTGLLAMSPGELCDAVDRDTRRHLEAGI